MKRLIAGAILLALIGLAACWPALSYGSSSGDSTFEPTRITRYLADFDLGEDGTLDVVETITVDFPIYDNRHGIFRFWDLADPNAPHQRREPHNIEVAMDGEAEPFVLQERERGRFTVARIGSEYRTLDGLHTYRISYSIDDAILPAGEERSRFYWNVIPGGWAQEIDRADIRVTLPTTADQVRCAVGHGETGGCTAEGEGTERLSIQTSGLAARTPVTLSTHLDMPAPEPSHSEPFSLKWSPVLGGSIAALVAIGLLTLAAGAAAWRIVRGTDEENPQFPLMYAPPEGVGPAQGQYILTERVGRSAFVATLMEAAEKGAVDLDRVGGEWTVRGLTDGAPRPLDDVTTDLIKALGVAKGGRFTAGPRDVKAGKVLKQAMERSKNAPVGWAAKQGHMTASVLGGSGGLFVIFAILMTAGILALNPFGATITALVPGAFAAFGLGLFAPGTRTRRTSSGRQLWSQVGGFRRVLATPSSQARFDFSGRKELYTAYLPWAVAFGVADQWAAKYRTEVGEEPPAPSYFAGGYTGAHTVDHVNQMVHDFDSTVDSAISSYQESIRPQSSGGGFSGGGGGGFSGGGGGGGGGGGSW